LILIAVESQGVTLSVLLYTDMSVYQVEFSGLGQDGEVRRPLSQSGQKVMVDWTRTVNDDEGKKQMDLAYILEVES
jgi:hypothetical protein